jgi:baculoviral IAP repeat-containing protein 6
LFDFIFIPFSYLLFKRCFEFDIFLPLDYPNSPPKVTLMTTGQGKVRFNPNLYANGKVCLSLLGTWSGPGWDPSTSSLLQVLVSIQSLIFVSDPYFNEPGYQMMIGTDIGTEGSNCYNATIREATLNEAIFRQMLFPSMIFDDVIKLHFKFKCRGLLAQVPYYSIPAYQD